MNHQTLSQQTALPDAPMVSVAITAYNSAKTIAATLEGVLAQRVRFPVEVVVGDDCSPDNTVEVVHGIAERYPGVIRLMARPHNLGIQRNYYQTFADCRGRYVAWLDADDLWTHPEKIERQVEALESDPGAVICGHFVRWVTPDGEVARERVPEIAPGMYGLSDILRSNFLPSPSVMFRRELAALLPEWYFEAKPLTDWPLYALAAQRGHILMLDGIYADYRLTPNSNLWGQGESFWYALDARFYGYVLPHLRPEMQRFARGQQAIRYERLSYYLRRHGDFAGALRAARSAVAAAPAQAVAWMEFAAAVANQMGLARRTG